MKTRSIVRQQLVLNREQKLRYISDCLAWLSSQVKIRNSVCFYDVNHVAEDVYSDLLNAILGLLFTNKNGFVVNCESIDLVDDVNHVVAQVTSQRNKGKLVDSLKRLDAKQFCGYRYVFVSIVDEPPVWRRTHFNIPEGVRFNPPEDVLGPEKLMRLCNVLIMEQLERVYKVCCIHFGNQDRINRVQMEDLKLFFCFFSEILAKESLIIDFCREYLDKSNPCAKNRLRSIRLLSKNQLRNLFLKVSDFLPELRFKILQHHELLEVVRHIELLHDKIDDCAFTEAQHIDIEELKELLLQERGLVVDALVLFADDLGINREDLFDEFHRAMNV